jgi:drug/metabolite transporter superfamily protein YnfA
MAQLDRVREQIAYFKYWQGIMMVTAISLFGWLITAAEDAPFSRVVLALIGVVALTLSIVVVHRHIARRIDEIGNL